MSLLHDNPVLILEQCVSENNNVPNWGWNAVEGQVIVLSVICVISMQFYSLRLKLSYNISILILFIRTQYKLK